MEVPLCGHATLACAHILKELGIESANFVFRAKETELNISFSESWIIMSFPRYSIKNISIPSGLNQTLGVEVREIYRSYNNWTVVLVDSEKEVVNASPNFDNLRNEKYGGLIALTSKSDNPEFDFVVRVFCDPECGITEDPVTGSANCILVPFWNIKTNKTIFKSKQLSFRTGEMKTELTHNKINLMGQAVTVMTINLLD